MKKVMIKALVELIGVILSFLSVDKIKQFADWVFDKAEDAIQDTENKLDDAVLAPLILKVRDAFQIPDNDAAQNQPNTERESDGEPAVA